MITDREKRVIDVMAMNVQYIPFFVKKEEVHNSFSTFNSFLVKVGCSKKNFLSNLALHGFQFQFVK